MKHYTYVLYSSGFDKFYIGHTNNLARRLGQHNSTGRRWTRTYRPWQLIYSESHLNKREAMRQEKYLKSLKNKKILQQTIQTSNSPK